MTDLTLGTVVLPPGAAQRFDAPAAPPCKISLPALVAGRLLVQGNSGAGKSWLLRRLLEEAHGQIQEIVIDPDGEFTTLADSFDFLVLGFTEIERIGAGTLAHHIREHGYSAVLDLSDCGDEERMRIVAEFATGLVEIAPQFWRPVLVAIDEAQLILPHYDPGDVEKSIRRDTVAAVSDIMGRGRKRGLVGIISTQRLAETAKAIVAKATNYIIGRTIFDRDLDRAAGFLGLTKGRASGLRRLADGEFTAIGPAFGPARVRFKVGATKTRHVGKTPELGAVPAIGAAAAKAMLAEMPDAPEPEPRRDRRSQEPGSAFEPAWTDEQRRTLVDGFAKGETLVAIANALGFTYDHVCRTARRMRLDFSARTRWSSEELQLVIAAKNEGLTTHEIMDRLRAAGFERGITATQQQINKLGLARRQKDYVWSEAEKAIVRAGYEAMKIRRQIMTDLEAAGFHGRTRSGIGWIAGQMGLHKAPAPWTEEEIEQLRRLAGEGRKPREIAQIMGRPLGGVHDRCWKLGIKYHRRWTGAERQRLADACERGERLVDVAKELDRDYAAVAKIANKMGLSFKRPAGPFYHAGAKVRLVSGG